jgi:spore coat polysaccharide biosynthesis protein SpsF (cytidylyltransferase family)
MSDMKLAVIIQARLSSRRLPGKVIRPILGKPLLSWLIDRLERCNPSLPIVVATSRGAEDDPIAEFCAVSGVKCYRGDLEDVASRFAAVVEQRRLDAFVRISGDSPLLDQRLVDHAVRLMQQGNDDLVTNVHPRSFPPGQSVEVVRAAAYRRARAMMTGSEEREHVTKLFYNHPEHFAIRNFHTEDDCRGVHLAIDTEEHFQVIEEMFRRMDRPVCEYAVKELVQLYRAVTDGWREEAA